MPNHRYSILFFLFFAISTAIEWKSGKMELVDFQVYYQAGQRTLEHSQIYQVEKDGHFVFKYSPVFACAMMPFSCFSFQVSGILFLVLTYLALIFSIYIIENELLRSHLTWIQSLAILVIFSKHIQKEIHLGQVNIILFSLIIFSIYFFKNSKWNSSFFYVFSVLIKPVGLILFPYYMVKGRLNYLGYLILIAGSFIGLSLMFLPFSNYSLWVNELIVELKGKSDLNSIDTQTIFAFFYRDFGLGKMVAVFFGVLVWGYFSTILFKKFRDKFPYFLIATIPLLTCTSNNFYLLSIPVFVYLIAIFSEMNLSEKIIFFISCILMCGNQYEIWGRAGVDRIDSFCPYAISLLLGLMLLQLHSYRRSLIGLRP